MISKVGEGRGVGKRELMGIFGFLWGWNGDKQVQVGLVRKGCSWTLVIGDGWGPGVRC